MKWLPPLCLLMLIALPVFSQTEQATAPGGWRYEVLRAGKGQQLTERHGALTHNQLVTEDGKVLVSTYAIGVPDYQLVPQLTKPFQRACSVMQAGGKYRFHIPIEDFKMASKGGASMDLPGKEVTWEVELLQILPPKQDVARVIAEVFKADGADAAYEKFQDLRSQRSTDVYFGEWEVNQLGYLFLQKGHTEYAIDILQYNAQAHPNSFNAHDSLGEAYHKAGNNMLAAQHYRQSLRLNSKNENARKMLSKLE